LVHSLKGTRTHQRLTLREKSQNPTFSKCNRHQEETKFYCKTCQILLCSLCVFENHQGHQSTTVYVYADEIRNELKNDLKPFENPQSLDQQENIRKSKENNMMELAKLKIQIRQLEETIKIKNLTLNQISENNEKVKMTHLILLNSIEEMGIMSLIDQQQLTLFKDKIQQLLNQKEFLVYPGTGALTWIRQNSKHPIEIEADKGQYLIRDGKGEYEGVDESREQIVGGTIPDSLVSSKSDKHFILDLQEYKLVVSKIFIRCNYSPHHYSPQMLLGSNDKINWIELSQFNLNSEISNTFTINATQPFRYLLLARNDAARIMISGWEISGVVTK